MTRRIRQLLRHEDGFTLTELLVAMPLLAVILAAIAGMLITLSTGNSQRSGQLTQQLTYFPTLDAMVQDLRTAMPPTLGGSPLISATATSIVFYSPDQVFATTGSTSPFHLREVAYQFTGGSLQKQFVTSTNTYTTVTSTSPWGTWTSASGNFPLASFPSAAGWKSILGTGVANDGSSPSIYSASFSYYDATGAAIATPVSAANIGLVRSIAVSVVADVNGSASAKTTYSNTATIWETQPTQ